jgi:hypothetical protein
MRAQYQNVSYGNVVGMDRTGASNGFLLRSIIILDLRVSRVRLSKQNTIVYSNCEMCKTHCKNRTQTEYSVLVLKHRQNKVSQKSLVKSHLKLNKSHVPLMSAVLLSLQRDLKLCILATLRCVYVSLSPTARVQLHRIYRVLLND